MTKREKQAYSEMDSVAYYSGCNGIEIKEIQYGIEDYVVFSANSWYSDSKGKRGDIHRAKVYYSANGDYFKYHGYRIPLNECIRMGY